MPRTYLFDVEQVFELAGRGCILAPGPSIEVGATAVHNGAEIQLQIPDGRIIDTTIAELMLIKRTQRPPVLAAPLLLPRNISKEQVPPGTQVFLMQGTE